MNRRLRHLWVQLSEEQILGEMAELLKRRYFDDWGQAETPEQRERLHLKCQMVEDMLNEFSAIIDFNRETDA